MIPFLENLLIRLQIKNKKENSPNQSIKIKRVMGKVDAKNINRSGIIKDAPKERR